MAAFGAVVSMVALVAMVSMVTIVAVIYIVSQFAISQFRSFFQYPL
jgi:hypothetical protein